MLVTLIAVTHLKSGFRYHRFFLRQSSAGSPQPGQAARWPPTSSSGCATPRPRPPSRPCPPRRCPRCSGPRWAPTSPPPCCDTPGDPNAAWSGSGRGRAGGHRAGNMQWVRWGGMGCCLFTPAQVWQWCSLSSSAVTPTDGLKPFKCPRVTVNMFCLSVPGSASSFSTTECVGHFSFYHPNFHT